MALGELKNGIGPDAYAIYQQVLAAVVERDHPVGSLYISENPPALPSFTAAHGSRSKTVLSWPLAIPMRQEVRAAKQSIH